MDRRFTLNCVSIDLGSPLYRTTAFHLRGIHLCGEAEGAEIV